VSAHLKKNAKLGIALAIAVAAIGMWRKFGRARHVDYDQYIAADMKQLLVCLRLFRDDVGRYPSPQEGLAALVNERRIAENERVLWRGPYWGLGGVKNASGEYVDHYGNTLRYDTQNEHPALTSPGRDHRFGTDDDIVIPPPAREQNASAPNVLTGE
jgi:hypothetical protein